jgi:N-acetylglutamate synthase-like GNAT family acetyltransferase
MSAEEFGDIVVRANRDGSLVRLKDVARLELGAENYTQQAYGNGVPATLVGLYQASRGGHMTTREPLSLRPLELRDVPACERILRALPDWFGIEESNRVYVESLRRLPGAVAEAGGEIVGFVALEEHNARSFEIHVMAVERSRHRRGIGHALVAWSRAAARERGAHWLHVRTRGPSTPDPDYEKTRAFYLAEGFELLFESFALGDPENPALVLVLRL